MYLFTLFVKKTMPYSVLNFSLPTIVTRFLRFHDSLYVNRGPLKTATAEWILSLNIFCEKIDRLEILFQSR